MVTIDNISYRKTSFENMYVSENGDIALIEFLPNGRIKKFFLKNHDVAKNGYCRVETTKGRHVLVHRLVYEAWGSEPLDKAKVIDHIDCNPRNNHISNLRQVTQKENVNFSVMQGNFCKGHFREVQIYDEITGKTTIYPSVREFLISINAPAYMIKHGSLAGLKKRKEYKRYQILKLPNF